MPDITPTPEDMTRSLEAMDRVEGLVAGGESPHAHD